MAVSLRAKQKHGAACAVIRRAELATSGGRRVLDPDISLIMGVGLGCSVNSLQDACQKMDKNTLARFLHARARACVRVRARACVRVRARFHVRVLLLSVINGDTMPPREPHHAAQGAACA